MTVGEKHPYEAGQPLPGSPYILGTVLGMGGTAVVYQAEDRTVGRQVVVKIVRPDVARRGRFTAEQMQREARTLVALQSETEHVVEVITAGITDDPHRLPYYVMELLSGRTLRSAFDRRLAERVPTSILEVTGIAIDLGVALEHAHRLRITHLDLKPENAFVHRKRDGALIMKLLDFGISTMLGETLHGFRGTYRYAAPEQIRGERVSAATDLYALGLVTYEALALRRPFELPGQRMTTEALARAHCELAPVPLEPLRPDAPPPLVALVTQCLAKRPQDRPPSAAFIVGRLREMRRDLERGPAAGRSYLETLTGGDAPSAAELLRAAVAASAQGSSASGPPASEVFITAAPNQRTPDPTSRTVEPYPQALLAGHSQSGTSAARVPPLHVAALLGIASAVVVALGIGAVIAVVSRASQPRVAPPPSPASSSSEPLPLAVSAPPPASTSAPPAIVNDRAEEHATPSLPSARPPPTPSPSPNTAARETHETRSERPEVRPAPSASGPRPTPASSSPPAGITTQKDWF